MKTLSALEMIHRDHDEITRLFSGLHADGSSAGKTPLRRLTALLHIHSDLEEEVFYPMVENLLGDEEWTRQALEDHAVMKELLMEIERLGPDHPRFEETFQVLEKNVRKHIQEEDTLILPRLEGNTALDQERLASEMSRRRKELEMDYAA